VRLPCEIVVNELLPFLRKSMADQLHSKGFTQTQIALMLNVSQPAVSYYLKHDMKQNRYSTEFNNEKIMELTDILLAGEPVSKLISGICRFCMSFRSYGVTCQFHRKQMDLEDECTACIVNVPITKHSAKNEALQDLRSAIELLEHTSDAVYLIPEVAIQIVRSISDPSSSDDVAAIPGRIVKVKEQLKHIANPEFGISSHMAEILMNLMRKSSTMDIRAAICIKYDHTIQNAINTLGIAHQHLNITYPKNEHFDANNKVADAIKDQISQDNIPKLVIDPGGEGREPIAYIFGRSAIEVVHQVIKITRRLNNH